MIKTHLLFKDFIDFVKSPGTYINVPIAPKEKFKNVVSYFLAIACLSGLLLGSIVILIDKLNLFKPLVFKVDLSYAVWLLVGVVFAPLVEEGIFRGFLPKIEVKRTSKWPYYISSLLFGLVHITNYEWDNSMIPFMAIITLPQIFLGLLFGYIRMIYGFWYAVLLHALYNAVLINISFLLDMV